MNAKSPCGPYRNWSWFRGMAGMRLKEEVSRPKGLLRRFLNSRSRASELNGLFLLLSFTAALGFILFSPMLKGWRTGRRSRLRRMNASA